MQDYRTNMLAVSVGEHVVLIGIAGSDADVSYITYLQGVDLGLGGHKFLSKFNSEVKFGRAYIDRDGDLALQMDRNSSGGVTVENIESDFEVFLLLITKFLSDYSAQGSV
ncbi:MAG: YbjN domain-containing protein [Parvularculaceae bacterium]